MKKRVAKKKVTKAKGTKRVKKKTRPQSDLSPRAVRGGVVKGGATDIFAKIGDIKGESGDMRRLNQGPIMRF
jgi:hypothetical protein